MRRPSRTQRKAKFDAGAARDEAAATAVKARVAQIDVARNGKNRGQKNGKRRGSVASLPRTSPSFSELDTNHDGRLSLEEYKAGFPDVANVEEEFKSLDTNADGVLSIDEYKAGHPDPGVVLRPRKPKKN